MSDHPEIPRVEFNLDGEGMNVEQAVARFRRIIAELAEHAAESGQERYSLLIEVRPCDCDSDIRGRDDYCPLHGDPEKLRERG